MLSTIRKSEYLFMIIFIFNLSFIRPAISKEGENLATTRREINKNDGLGTYSFRFDTTNSIARKEEGKETEEGLVVTGAYGYIGTDGLIYIVKFQADGTGYHPQLIVTTVEKAISTKRIIHNSALVASLLG